MCLEADIYAQKHKCKSRHIPKHVKAHFCSFSSFHALVCPFQHISGFFLFSAHFRHLFALLSTFQIFFFPFPYYFCMLFFPNICQTENLQLEGGTLLFAGATDWKLVGRKAGELGKSANTQWSPTRCLTISCFHTTFCSQASCSERCEYCRRV